MIFRARINRVIGANPLPDLLPKLFSTLVQFFPEASCSNPDSPKMQIDGRLNGNSTHSGEQMQNQCSDRKMFGRYCNAEIIFFGIPQNYGKRHRKISIVFLKQKAN